MPAFPKRTEFSITRHYKGPGFLVSALLLGMTAAGWWVIDHNQHLERLYRLDKLVLVLGIVISSLVYVTTSLWRTLKKDVLELTNANKALVEQQALLRLSQTRSQHLFETNPQPMYFYDLETLRFLDVNDAAVRSYGYSRAEFLNMTLLDLRSENERGSFLLRYRENIDRFEKTGCWRHRRKDGTEFLVRISAYRQVTGGREVELVLAIDITGEAEAQEALKQSEASFRSFVDNAPYGIFRSHLEQDCVLEINPALVRMLGYEDAEEVRQLKVSRDLYVKAEERVKLVEALFSQGKVDSVEIDNRRKDGKIIRVQISGRICGDNSGKPCLFEGFIEDVTEKHRLEDQLRQSQKMDAVGRLAGGIAHDFNNMLTAVIGYSDILGGSQPLEERQRMYVTQISKAAHRAAALTQQLLAFSRQQVLRPTMMDINSAIDETLTMINRLLGEQIVVSFEKGESVPLVFVDGSQVTQILMNLCLNARDAMPNGGVLRIRTEGVRVDAGMAEENQGLTVNKVYAKISISDTGIGMSPEVQAKIFEPFFTTKGLGKGTGLGLATVYGLIQQSGGHIAVRSRVGFGTSFSVYLPACEEGAGQGTRIPTVQ